MVNRQGFEHQKDINLEAYTLGLKARSDINFRIDFNWGIVGDVSDLPMTGNQVNDAIFVRDNVNNWIWIWNGSAWTVDVAWGWGGTLNYVTFPTTIGNKITFSVGTNADLIDESTLDRDPLTQTLTFPDTVTVVFDWTTINFINGATSNYVDSTLNFDNTVSNYTNGSVSNYDNTSTVNLWWTTNITGTVNISGGSVVVNVASDSANQTYNGTDATWVLPSTPMTLDVLHITTDSGTNLIRGVDYSLSGATITWILNPTSGEKLYARWLKTGSLSWFSYLSEVPTGTVNGINNTFTISQTVFTNSEDIYINWLLQYPTTHYTLTGTSLVFVTPPAIGSNLFAKWTY